MQGSKTAGYLGSGRRTLLVITGCLLVTGATLFTLWPMRKPEPRVTDAPPPVAVQSTDPFADKRPSNRPAKSSYSATAPTGFTLLDLDQRRASWTNLSRQSIWFAPGWTFEESSLISPSVEKTTAIFRQPYQRLAISFRVTALSAETAPTSQVPAASLDCEVRLRHAESRHSLVVRLAQARLSLTEDSGTDPRVLRDVELPTTEASAFVRISCSGERLLVALDDQLLINAAWPRQLVGKAVLIHLHAPGERQTWSEMRIDGE